MHYRERLSPPLRLYIACLLIIPGLWLVLAPLSPILGVIVGAALYVVTVLTIVATSPVILVTDTTLSAGRARIERTHLGTAEAFTGADATAARGVRLDHRAWLVIRGWIDPVVEVAVDDDRDSVPYWLISTRHPQRLCSLLNRRSTEDEAEAPSSDAP